MVIRTRLSFALFTFCAVLASRLLGASCRSSEEGGESKTALLFAYFRTESEALHYAVSRVRTFPSAFAPHQTVFAAPFKWDHVI